MRQAVCNDIPSYVMNCFKFPKKVRMELDSMISDFFWGKHDREGRMHWVGWHKLTRNKLEGGWGFREFASFNDALLVKQAWRLLCNPNEMWGKQLKGLYFHNGNLLHVKKGSRATWGWSNL